VDTDQESLTAIRQAAPVERCHQLDATLDRRAHR
jgi:hypothetical protein